MKKTILVLIFITITYIGLGKVTKIPEEAIRMRIIPHSNAKYDQDMKEIVKNELEQDMYILLKNTKGINEARTTIQDNLAILDMKVNNVLKTNNYSLGYSINYGLNYFPKKEYLGSVYDEGMYESLVVTLGQGKGDNWWCVLFPPFCLLEGEENQDIEYKWFIQEMIEKYL